MTNKGKVKFKYWPFVQGERVKLIRISKPYQNSNNRWLIDGLFYSKASHSYKSLQCDIATLPALHFNGLYVDGEFIEYESTVEMEISLSATDLEGKIINPFCKKYEHNPKFDYYTFGLSYNNNFLIIPLIEIVRAILAPDVFWMHRIAQLDTLDTLFINEVNSEGVLHINCDSEMSLSYIESNPKIWHLSWILTNPNIYKMVNALHHNIVKGNGFLFLFDFSSLDMVVLAEKWDKNIFVREIRVFRNKQINANAIDIKHPKLKKRILTNEIQEKPSTTIKTGKNSNDYDLDSDKTGFHSEPDFVSYDHLAKSGYTTKVEIKRHRQNEESPTSVETEETIKKYKEDDNTRTTAETGGSDRVPQLEFNNFDNINEEIFAEINSIFELIKEREDVRAAQKTIGTLKSHKNPSKFSKLLNGSPRKYFVGIIILNNGKEAILIELEGEQYALATLMLVSDNNIGQDKISEICHQIFESISISWPSEILDIITKNNNLKEYRYNHTKVDIAIKANKIFSNII